MVAHYHGQVWNATEFARSLGASEATARRYLDILVGAYMVRILPPWFENLSKRQVKSPKIYLRDTGLLHALLQLPALADIQSHPKAGASWEGFAIEQIVGLLHTRDSYFWATHSGAELDLLVRRGGKQYGFEFKYTDAPGLSRSMHVAVEDLALEHLWVVYPGAKNTPWPRGFPPCPSKPFRDWRQHSRNSFCPQSLPHGQRLGDDRKSQHEERRHEDTQRTARDRDEGK